MFHDAPNINYLFAELLVEELVRQGVEWFVISPGSRSAPLAWTVASHPRAKHVVHFDERGAAFHALGIAKATLKPAAFICTSGTAAANALPAAVEASYSGIPLVLITADRPERLRGSGSNQTINQHGLYREFVRYESNFAVDAASFDAIAVLTEIDRAVALCTATWSGPVHMNCQFDEPLAPEGEVVRGQWATALLPVTEWMEKRLPYRVKPNDQPQVDQPTMARLQEILVRPVPGLIVVGQLSGTKERDDVGEILERLQWPFIPDITSGLRLGPPPGWSLWGATHYAEDVLQHARTIIHIGGPTTSRRLLDPLSRFATIGGEREFVRISPTPGDLDPFKNVTLRVRAMPSVLRECLKHPTTSCLNRWPNSLLSRDIHVYEALWPNCSPNDRTTELSTTLAVTFAGIPRVPIFAGNSMPIRDLDLYGLVNLNHNTWVVANRGASGIDGNIATASGYSRATGEPIILLLGDLAILHDLNSLALLRDLPAPVVVIALNNNGGGIFSFLPIAKHSVHFEQLFGTPHGMNFEHAAAQFGLEYVRPQTNIEFTGACTRAIESERSCLIEIRADRDENVRLHRELDAKIRAALDNASH